MPHGFWGDEDIPLEPRVVRRRHGTTTRKRTPYPVAQAVIDYAEEPVNLVRVQRVMDEANWSISRTRAIAEGRPLPEPPRSCSDRAGTASRPSACTTASIPSMSTRRQRFDPVQRWWRPFGGLLLGSMLGGFGGGWIVDEHGDDVDGDNSDLGDW